MLTGDMQCHFALSIPYFDSVEPGTSINSLKCSDLCPEIYLVGSLFLFFVKLPQHFALEAVGTMHLTYLPYGSLPLESVLSILLGEDFLYVIMCFLFYGVTFGISFLWTITGKEIELQRREELRDSF